MTKQCTNCNYQDTKTKPGRYLSQCPNCKTCHFDNPTKGWKETCTCCDNPKCQSSIGTYRG